MDRWRGHIAIVTGSSSGIGAAIAVALVTSGLQVVALARRKHLMEEIALKLRDQKGILHVIQTDISKEEDVLAAFKWTEDNLGPVSILINSAGVMKSTNLTNGNTKAWKEAFDTNVLGLCIATREAIKSMQVNNINGHIIHINSTLGHKVPPSPVFNVYPATKFATTALTETLRRELNAIGSKIKISAISPGRTATNIIDNSNSESNSNMAANEFIKDIAELQPEDVAEAILYILGTPPHVQIHDLIIKPIGEIF